MIDENINNNYYNNYQSNNDTIIYDINKKQFMTHIYALFGFNEEFYNEYSEITNVFLEKLTIYFDNFQHNNMDYQTFYDIINTENINYIPEYSDCIVIILVI